MKGESLEAIQSLLPLNAEHVGQINARQNLGVHFAEQDGLSYLDTPLHIYRSHQATGERFDIISDHSGLNGEQLFSFLHEISPYKEHAPRGVIDDWRTIVEPPETRPALPGNTETLLQLHERLGDPWTEFMKSRSAFLETMQSGVPPKFASNTFESPERARETIFEYQIHWDSAFYLNRPDSIAGIAEFLKPSGMRMEDRITLVIDELAAEYDLLQQNRSESSRTPEELQDQYSQWSSRMQLHFLRQILAHLPEEQADKFAAHLQAKFYDSYILPSGETVCFQRRDIVGSLEDAFQNPQTVQQGEFEAQIITFQAPHDKIETVVVPDTIKRIVSPPVQLHPLVSWTRSEGKRSFIYERAASPDRRTFIDGVLGALVVAYLSPEMRTDWPKWMQIEGRRQFMWAAQIPVYALMRQSQLLQSNLIEVAESIS